MIGIWKMDTMKLRIWKIFIFKKCHIYDELMFKNTFLSMILQNDAIFIFALDYQ